MKCSSVLYWSLCSPILEVLGASLEKEIQKYIFPLHLHKRTPKTNTIYYLFHHQKAIACFTQINPVLKFSSYPVAWKNSPNWKTKSQPLTPISFIHLNVENAREWRDEKFAILRRHGKTWQSNDLLLTATSKVCRCAACAQREYERERRETHWMKVLRGVD